MKLTIVTTALIPLALSALAQNNKKPNVIFLLADDLGYGEVGFQGQKLIETPNIDALAASGKVLNQHYSGSPVSAPSRCVLLTGLHTGHSQIRGNDELEERGNVWSHKAMFENPALEGQKPMSEGTQTIAHVFQNAGYKTACIGKWGLGAPGSVSEPNKMGFDYFFGYNCQRLSHNYFPTHLYRNEERVLLKNEFIEAHTPLGKEEDPNDAKNYQKFTSKDYAPDLMAVETVDFIDKNKDNPFFIWWTTTLPHVPLQAPKRLVDYYVEKFGAEKPYTGKGGYFPSQYPHATYAAMVTYIDEQVGMIVEKLKQEGIYENTIIVFTSDNGPACNGGTDPVWFDSAQPFIGKCGWGKTSVHEGGVRVPTIVAWEGKIKPSNDNVISGFQDWMPTLLEMVGQKNAVPQNIDGISLVPTLLGKGTQKQHKYLYWEYPEKTGDVAVRAGDWKLIVTNTKKAPVYSLFNIKNDPTEQVDLAEKNPEMVVKLKKMAIEAHVPSENVKFRMGLPLSM